MDNFINWVISSKELIVNSLPPLSTESAGFYLLHLFFLAIAFQALSMIVRLVQNKTLAIESTPFSTERECDRKILLIGDSTAVGTGASRPEDTIAGRLAHDYPDSQVINLAVNGARIVDLPKQIEPVSQEKFNLIIISVGGNDVWHFTSFRKMRKALAVALPLVSEMSDHRTVFLTYNNISSGPIFPSIIQWILDARSIQVQEIIRDATSQFKIPVIDLFSDEAENPFRKDPTGLFAKDGIHPSSRGYEMWYRRMWREMSNRGFRY